MHSDILLPLIPAPWLKTVSLRAPVDAVVQIFSRLKRSEVESEFLDAVDLVFEDAHTKYIITISGGIVHGVTFDTFIYRQFELLRFKKISWLLRQYKGGEKWTFFNDEGFGPSWRRSGDYAMAYYSSQCDILSINLYELDRKKF